uniref:Putative secreted protein n=1 Tax=Ixodes ricinus TaxID=34613 RepID=A0A6B0U9V7_IXORI
MPMNPTNIALFLRQIKSTFFFFFLIFAHVYSRRTSVEPLSNITLKVRISLTWSNSTLGRFATSLVANIDIFLFIFHSRGLFYCINL